MTWSRLGLAALLVLLLVSVTALVGCEKGVPSPAPGGPSPAVPSSQGSGIDIPSVPSPAPLSTPLKAPPEAPEELKAIWEAYALLAREFVDRSNLDTQALIDGAIRGMVDALDHPFTSYIDPKTYQLETSDISGKFEGIGAEVNMTRDGRLMITAPLPGTPAEAAGIKPGDVILEVDGESIKGLSLFEAIGKIRGPRGTKVSLLIKHLFQDQTEVIEIVRGVIRLTSVTMSITEEGFAYIRLRTFYEDTDSVLKEVLKEAKDQKAKGIVLDLRNNPGGILSTVVDVASQFLKDGLVLYEVDGAGRRTDWRVRRNGIATDIPMVVLVNEFSASGSEVLAGALQDQNRAKVVGTTTFGKGSVNILRPLTNGGGLYLTFARWYTPKGRMIEGKGVEPDVVVKVSPSGNQRQDVQFDKALEILQSRIAAAVP